jgi:hypothetical protein
MREVWLKQNHRAILFGMAPPALGTLLAVLWLGWLGASASAWVLGLAWLTVGIGVLMLAVLAVQFRQPRIAYQNGKLFLNLRSGAPVGVPIEFVEAFLLSVGPAMLPGREDERTETRTLTIRLADRAAEWADVEVKPALGKWCGGYVTIRGTWCEPLNVAIVNRLNQRLAEVQQLNRENQAKEVA